MIPLVLNLTTNHASAAIGAVSAHAALLKSHADALNARSQKCLLELGPNSCSTRKGNPYAKAKKMSKPKLKVKKASSSSAVSSAVEPKQDHVAEPSALKRSVLDVPY